MALGVEMQRKRDAARMSATSVSFFLDHECHKKFLRATTNQELEAENTALKAYIEELKEANDHWYNEMVRAIRDANVSQSRCLDLERELTTVKKRYDYLKKAHFKVSKQLKDAQDGYGALRIALRRH